MAKPQVAGIHCILDTRVSQCPSFTILTFHSNLLILPFPGFMYIPCKLHAHLLGVMPKSTLVLLVIMFEEDESFLPFHLILSQTRPLSYTNSFSVADYSPSHFVITYGTHPPVPCISLAAMLASRVTVFAHLSCASCSNLPLALGQQVTSNVRKLGKYVVLEKSMEEAYLSKGSKPDTYIQLVYKGL